MNPRLHRILSALAIGLIGLVVVSVWTVTPRPLRDQPFPDARETVDTARHLAQGQGYVTDTYSDRIRPRSPPGYPLALVPFLVLGHADPADAQRGATTYAVLYVVAAALTAWMIGGPIAACLMALFVGFSPFARTEGSLIMADGFTASLTVVVAALVYRPSNLKMWMAGAIAGALVAVRFQMGLVLIALCIVLPKGWRRRAALAAGPPLIALALFQWAIFGSPFRTGYEHVLSGNTAAFAWRYLTGPLNWDGPWVVADVLDGWFLRWVCPCRVGGPQASLANVWFYPAVLLGFFWIYTVPFASAFGFVQIWRRRREPMAQFSAVLIALTLGLFIFYFYQGTRFMAGPATLLDIFAATYFTEWIELGMTASSAAATGSVSIDM
jgi:hypothetical protein